jgi:pimeloyl-ACP methyl ester carboxylesterase
MKRALVILACTFLVACGGASGAGTAVSAPTSYGGGFRLPAAADSVGMTLAVDGARGVVTLAAGHSVRNEVAVTRRGKRVTFALPGRPARVLFDGRIKGTTIAGTVRQGAQRGTFRLRRGAVGGNAWAGSYGRYALVQSVYGRVLLDTEDGAMRQLFPAGANRFAVGEHFGERGAGAGELDVGSPQRLVWTRGGERVEAARLPLRQFEVRYASRGATQAGTLTLPSGNGPFAAVALVHGSGAVSRSLGQLWVATFVRHGIAVLAYDKRGINQSGGRYPGEAASDSTIDVLARDAEAAARFLSAQPEIDRGRVGLAGGSQAGWIMPLAASREPAIRWILALVSPSISVGQTDTYANSTAGGAVTPQRYAEVLDEVRRLGSIGFDPQPAIRALRIPVLWLYGGKDMTVPTPLCVPVLERIKAETGADLSWIVLPNATHGLLEVPSGLVDESAKSRGYPPDMLPAVSAWLRAHGLTGA